MIDKLALRLSQCSAKLKFSLWLLLLCSSLITGLQLWQGGAKIQSDILAMLPKIQQDPLTQTALNRVEQALSNSIYLALVADNKTQAITAAQTLMSSLNSGNHVAFTQVRSADINQAEAINSYYFEHRFNLLSPAQANLLASSNLDALIMQAQEQLYNPFGYANSGLIANDPLLLYPTNLQAMAPKQTLTVQQGILLGNHHVDGALPQDKVAAIVMAKGIGSAFNPNAQTLQLSALQQAIDKVHQQDPKVEILKAGALFHASVATQSAKTEVSTLGLASLIGVSLLVWLAFRSVMPLSIAILTISTSLLTAIVTTLLVFSELHLLTLVFGTSLIGIAIDYSFHFYCERLAQPKSNATQVIQQIFPAITLALITSVLAYSGIGLAPFPGMQQVAVFCAAGLIGAYVTLILAYPLLASGKLPNREKTLQLAERYLTALACFQSKLNRKTGLLLLIILTLISAVGISQLTTDDDIRNLQQSPAHLLNEEQQLRTILSGGTDNQFLLVRAKNEELLLQSLEALTPELNKLIEKGIMGNAFSLNSYLPSQKEQEQNYQLQSKIYQQLPAILASLGLDESLLVPLEKAYQKARSQYIDADSFIHSEAGKLFAPLWIAPSEQQTEFGSIVLLGGITDLGTLAKLFPHGSDIQLIDKVGDISNIMGEYRQLTLILLAIAMVIAAVIFSTRFSIKQATLVVAVPALSAIFTLALLGIMDSPLTLFHALALILVFGIGVDYSLFFAESKQQSRGVMMAVFMSACSTILAFGLLAFSSTPAIHNFGLTLLLGIVFTFLLSPFVQIFTRTIR
ncbi:MMPL family transporter [Shewanella sp. D64]|uniref:MMPL family transporter n=1 Tax=unclassified Shewanella TaxID=196818 RepID=UPI0022BA2C17|nr:MULTISPECIES: MMPL family transporter [unclassified Shewanella]MEC4726858.1 MMPL family transporter [Shewanella sp. D64]MEC4739030.1 MMPL family transporter [Shewanella sp. E94]WBJ95889.1 MMPL family transporter [Shewanella sp. MTB7]